MYISSFEGYKETAIMLNFKKEGHVLRVLLFWSHRAKIVLLQNKKESRPFTFLQSLLSLFF